MTRVQIGAGTVTIYPAGPGGKSEQYTCTGITLEIEEASARNTTRKNADGTIAQIRAFHQPNGMVLITYPGPARMGGMTTPIAITNGPAKGSQALRGAQWKREKKGRRP